MSKVSDYQLSRIQDGKEGITKIAVSGYKSIFEEREIEIKPLTLLAGANSSGKSSIMQPLLLLKQTLEASYDPGALLLNGPNVFFTNTDQFLSHIGDSNVTSFSCSVQCGSDLITIVFTKDPGKAITVSDVQLILSDKKTHLSPTMNHHEVLDNIPEARVDIRFLITHLEEMKEKPELTIETNRCFFDIGVRFKQDSKHRIIMSSSPVPERIVKNIRDIIHLPGLRRNPARTYPLTPIRTTFPGTFDNYFASVIAKWDEDRNPKLTALAKDMKMLGLTWKIAAEKLNDTEVGIRIGRGTTAGQKDLVDMADVGLGVSQALPVLVALHAAYPGQLVYLEQPEIHLHPKAQAAMADILLSAVKRGVKIVLETHSALLLLGIQTAIAENRLLPDLVNLYWFARKRNGITDITSAHCDEAGAFGDWPEDFAETTLQAESRYLDAAESHIRG